MFFSVNVKGQALPDKITIASVKQHNSVMECRLASPSPFYVGAQVYVLHVASQQFDLSLQEDSDSVHVLTFIIPLSQYATLPNMAAAYLSYGSLTEEQQYSVDHALSNAFLGKTCRYLGVFTKPTMSK